MKLLPVRLDVFHEQNTIVSSSFLQSIGNNKKTNGNLLHERSPPRVTTVCAPHHRSSAAAEDPLDPSPRITYALPRHSRELYTPASALRTYADVCGRMLTYAPT